MKTALEAADPHTAILENLPKTPGGRLFILSIGKAAAPMAEAAAGFYHDGFEGILYAPKGYGKTVPGFEPFEGTHPLPSQRNVEITKKIIAKIERLSKGDMLLALVSGGTSALLCAPLGVTLEEKIAESQRLLKSGLGMAEINARRTELSAVKGGKLAKIAHPARVETLIVSDVTGDDPKIVGSAPTGGGKIVLTADAMLKAVEKTAISKGISVSNLGQVDGEAKEVGEAHAALATGYYGARPHLILSGGETSVTVKGEGKGGRNTEYALSLCLALDDAEGIYGLAIDTDGHDGVGPSAGARFDPGALERASIKGLDAKLFLKNNDSGSFFEVCGGLIITGPTFTNLNDLRMVLLV